MSCSSMDSEAGLMSGLGAWEKFSLRRLKAPAGEGGSEGLSWAARGAPSPWAPLREPVCA